MSKDCTPVLLLTGYLGSGKTTLLNHILGNKRGIKFAVIVNDIGEVNIDETLIRKEGIVGKKNNDDLVALQNGCICCTLKMDLVAQLYDICEMKMFDYIVIEASGICEPEPIAQTICSMPQLSLKFGHLNNLPKLDCIVTVVDALRMQSEFACGDSLKRKGLDEEDIENLIIQQIEFCNTILLNKISEVSAEDAARIKAIIRAIQPKANIIECDYADVDIEKLVNTNLFNFNSVATSATWINELERRPSDEEEEEAHHHHHHHDHDDDDDDDDDEHEHHHDHDDDHDEHEHHHHHDDEGEAEEYGIQTFVYYRRAAFDINKFDYFVAKKWQKKHHPHKRTCLFLREYGYVISL
jgi:G3E family GTPase